MKFSEVELPTNKRFGFFFTLMFSIFTGLFYINNFVTWAYVFFAIAILLFVVTVVRADTLLPLNKLWMRLGHLLGMIVSPIILGLVFFGLFTPIAFAMKLTGRDELNIKFMKKTSHWILRDEKIQAHNFKNQF